MKTKPNNTSQGKSILFHILYFFAFFGMLHSTFLFPVQLMAGNIELVLSRENSSFANNTSLYINPDIKELSNYVKTGNTIKDSDINTEVSEVNRVNYYNADILSGIIGINPEIGYDDATDNIFRIAIEEIPDQNYRAFLTYELKGLKDHSCIGRSLNAGQSVGGTLLALSDDWTVQNEEIDLSSIHKGDNYVMFSSFEEANVQYKVRNVKIKIERSDKRDDNFEKVVFTNSSRVVVNDKGEALIKGFIREYDEHDSFFVNGREVNVFNNEFSALVPAAKRGRGVSFDITLKNQESILFTKRMTISEALPADIVLTEKDFSDQKFSMVITKEDAEFSFPNVTLNFSNGSITSDTRIAAVPLRKIDCAPLNPGLINVTRGGSAYRFTPDGIMFNKPVQMSLAYDTALIPSGYNERDIRTYYFNVSSKRWEEIAFDSVDVAEKRIISSTVHFSDYINGIIQVPESPQTAAYTPTMMNDIKAADPSANITLISPPQANSGGSASVTFPIKIPAGRKGMQPEVTLNYNSDGGSGWAGLGWSIEMPAITIDTRWGVPTFGDLNANGSLTDDGENIETEIYQLNGEQLMYPPLNGMDWMPHRHSGTTVLETPARERLSGNSAVFSVRKQGNFSKIQRLGNSPDTYYWKVTATDGTIYWYGAKDPSDLSLQNSNAVIRDSHNNIVHWALFCVEDVFGNNIKYTYHNGMLTASDEDAVNLSNSKYFYPRNICYTGYKETDGEYNVEFVLKMENRTDLTLSSRLGIMQIDPYYLDKINVKLGETIIRSYTLNFEKGRFEKTLLHSIAEYDKAGNLFYENIMEYYDDINFEGRNVYFSTAYKVDICPDKCFEAEFVVPALSSAPVYNYYVDTSILIQLPYCSDKTLAKIEYIEIDGERFVPEDENMFLTHYPSPSCPSYNILNPPPPDPVTQNIGFSSALEAWLEDILDFMHPSQLQVTNASGVYLMNAMADSNIANVNGLQASFKSRTDKDIYYRMVFPMYPAYNFTGKFNKAVTYTSTALPISIVIQNSDGLIVFNQYPDILDPYYFNQFQNDLVNYIGGTPSPYATLSPDNNSIKIHIPATQKDYIQVNVGTASGSNSYPFLECAESLFKGKSLTYAGRSSSVNHNTSNKMIYENNIVNNLNVQKGRGDSETVANGINPLPELSFTDNILARYRIKSLNTAAGKDTECNQAFNNLDFNLPINTPSFKKGASLLGATTDYAVNAGLYLGVGVGKDVTSKLTSLGAQFNLGWNKSEAFLSMVDIDGDGLDDVVVKSGDDLYYKKHYIERKIDVTTGEMEIGHSYSANLPINGINNYYQQQGKSTSLNFQVSFGNKLAGGFAGADKSVNNSEVSVYFTDANGDGLIDIVKDEVVYFNYIDESGVPTFSVESDLTENMLITASARLISKPEELIAEDIELPGHDVVRIWEAPADGEIVIHNSIELTDLNSEAQLSIEYKSYSEPCYSTLAPIPHSQVSVNHYSAGISFLYIPTADCGFPYTAHRIHGFIYNSNTIYSVNNPLYLTHYENGQLTNKCPATVIGEDETIQNADFDNEYTSFIYTGLSEYSPFYVTSDNTSAIYHTNEGYRTRSSCLASFYSQHMNDNGQILIRGYEGSYNHMQPLSYFPEEVSVSPLVNILIYTSNEQDPFVFGPYNLMDQYHIQLLTNDLISTFNVTDVQINNDNFVFNLAMKSENYHFLSMQIEYDNIQNTYLFAPCNSGGKIVERVPEIIIEKCEESDVELAVMKMIASGEELNFSIPETTLHIYFNIDSISPENETAVNFILNINNLGSKWYNSKGELVVDSEKVATLNSIFNVDYDSIYKEYMNELKKEVYSFRSKRQAIAKRQLQDYYKSFAISETANTSIKESKSSVSTSLPCLLFGAFLNGSQPSVTNTIQNRSINCDPNQSPLYVNKGDTIFFRVHTKEEQNPAIIWNTEIEYVDQSVASTIDQNGLPAFNSAYEDGFILSSESINNLKNSGTFSIFWDEINVEQLTDDVTFEIVQQTLITEDEYTVQSVENNTIFSAEIPAGTATTVLPFDLENIEYTTRIDDYPLISHSLIFKVKCNSNVDWKSIEWRPVVTCVYDAEDIIGENSVVEGELVLEEVFYPVADYDIYKNYTFSTPYTLYDISNKTGTSMSIEPVLNNVFQTGDNSKLYFVVKSNGSLIGKKTIEVIDGVVTITPASAIALNSAGDNIEIGYYTDERNLDNSKVSAFERMNNAASALAILYSDNVQYDILYNEINMLHRTKPWFGNMYRNWGQFMYSPEYAGEGEPLPSPLEGNFINPAVLIPDDSYYVNLQSTIESIEDYNFDDFDLNDEEEFDAFNNAISNFRASSEALSKRPLLIAGANRMKLGELWVEKYIGQHEQCYTAANEIRAADLVQSYNGIINAVETPFQGDLYTGAYAINRYSHGGSSNFSAGVGIGGIANVSTSKSINGNNKTLTEYIDMNGDRYPDVVAEFAYQQTRRTGGLLPFAIGRNNLASGDLAKFSNDNVGISASGSYPLAGQTSSTSTSARKPLFKTNNPNAAGGVAANIALNTGTSRSLIMWLDINGDGLADKLDASQNITKVNYNNGKNGFISIQYAELPIGIGQSISYSGGTGFNWKQGSIEGGISVSRNYDKNVFTLQDVNGDGLPDLVERQNKQLVVRINNGSHFGGRIEDFTEVVNEKQAEIINNSANIGFTIALPIPLLFVTLKFPVVTLNGQASESANRTIRALADYDGDGFQDLLEEDDENTITVRYSTIRRTNKLKKVTNGLKGSFIVDYEVSPKSYNNPNALWVMSSLIIDDGYGNVFDDGASVYAKRFEYQDGKYDRREREFLGFASVKTIDCPITAENKPGSAYRTSETFYHNESYFLKGLVKGSRIYQGTDRNALMARDTSIYIIKPIVYESDGVTPRINYTAGNLPYTFDVGGREGRSTAAVLLDETISYVYELQREPIFTKSSFVYDNIGRITKYRKFADNSYENIDYESQIQYHDIAALETKNILSVPSEIEVKVNNTVKRKRTVPIEGVDTNTGMIKKIVANIGDGQYAITDMTYDDYGNLESITLPQNNNQPAQRMSYTYTYDERMYKYVLKVKDAFNYESTSVYDYMFDVVTKTFDLAGNETRYSYDNAGRLTRIAGPNEIDSLSDPFTLIFEYYPLGIAKDGSTSNNADASASDFMPYAITKHFDDLNNGQNTIDTKTFSDGLGRVVQVKKDIEINLNSNRLTTADYQEAMSVSGKVIYDAYGRAVKQHQPVWEIKQVGGNNLVNLSTSQYFSEVDYDLLDRPVKSTDAAGNTSLTTYGISNGYTFVRNETEKDHASWVINESYKDMSGNVVKTVGVDQAGAGNITTLFNYNAIGELMSYTDSKQLTSGYTYDLLGRKTSFSHPDQGLTSYQYDAAGNLVRLYTANLGQNKYIEYLYHFNRLTDIVFPPDGSTPNISNVKCYYGEAGNSKGRVSEQADATGAQIYTYGRMGEIISVERVIVNPVPGSANIRVTMNYAYDSWNRITKMTFPDGEEVYYRYDKGGNLREITNKIGNSFGTYVQRIEYDHFEQKTIEKYNNGVYNLFDYTSDLRRLSRINVLKPDNTSEPPSVTDYLKTNFSFDKIGNITSVSNTAAPVNNLLGQYTHSYGYDNFNRLVNASGSFAGSATAPPDRSANYTLLMEYSSTGEINKKTQVHNKNGFSINQNTYTHTYTHESNSHRLEKITKPDETKEIFEYDNNGNVVLAGSGSNETRLTWDEANRLKQTDMPALIQNYWYDAAGERVLKGNARKSEYYLNGQKKYSELRYDNFTIYPNGYLTISSENNYTKHYYMGSQRFASRNIASSGGGWKSVSSPELTGLKHRQQDDLKAMLKQYDFDEIHYTTTSDDNEDSIRSVQSLYYFHPDHLGTSTLLTDNFGNPYQFFLNLPFGETMAQQKASGNYSNPYLFNGKELDEETGLYYYGARYYNPRYSVWLGVDPMVEKYSGVSPYNYTLNSPVIFVDPDGRDVDPTASGYSDAEDAAKLNPKFAEIYNAWKNDPGKVIKFNHIDGEEVGGYPGYEGKNDAGQDVFSVNWDPSLTKELGVSGIYEETYHLMEAIAGKEIAFAKNTGGPETGYGVDGLDLMDEVRAKMWVVNNIKGIKSTYNENGYVYRTHYGQVKKSISSNSLLNDLFYGIDKLTALNTQSTNQYSNKEERMEYQPRGFTGKKYSNFSLTPLYPRK